MDESRLITLRHKVSGRIYYTFEHWDYTKDGTWACNIDKPSHKTQVVVYIPKDECEIINAA